MIAPSVIVITPDELRRLVREEVVSALSAMPQNDVLTLRQAAALLKRHPKSLARCAARGDVPGHKNGRDWRFIRSELMAWMEKA